MDTNWDFLLERRVVAHDIGMQVTGYTVAVYRDYSGDPSTGDVLVVNFDRASSEDYTWEYRVILSTMQVQRWEPRRRGQASGKWVFDGSIPPAVHEQARVLVNALLLLA